MHLIGINGFKTSGKDTTYQIVRDLQSEVNVGRAAFADKLKIMAAKALGFERPDSDLIALMDQCKELWTISVQDRPEGFTQEFHYLTGREYLQYFGGKAREVFGDTFWIDQVLPADDLMEITKDRALEARYPGIDILCITDVRYPNEAERVRALGGVVWEVVRPGLESDGHGSEKPLPRELVNFVIRNDGDLTYLRSEVKRALEFTL
jgi:hypothetical protein